jgi:mannose-1-phosphate guanylyltransferase
MLYATIMAGGSGTRFWPASRRARPKQLLRLFGETSMLQASVGRLSGLVAAGNISVLTNALLVEATRQQLPALPPASIIGEPCKRDTAPCVALAAALNARRDPDAIMLVTPADHVIQRVDLFHEAVRTGEQLLADDPARIITFGIQPTYPAEVFGYIERGASIGEGAWKVARFREKPDGKTAQEFVASGRFFWNAGIFMWRCQTVLEALQRFEPAMMKHVARIAESAGTETFDDVFREEFTAIEGKSIDYAVMEHYENVCVIRAPFDWDDVGNWTAIPRLAGTDPLANSCSGKTLLLDSRNCIVHSSGDHLIVTLGVQNCIVVHTDDATLVTDLQSEAAIRRIAEELELRGLDEYL